MKRIRYTMPARSQGKLYTQRQQARLVEKDVHRWVFANNMDPDVETLVRKWLARTHIVLNNTSPLPTTADTERRYEGLGKSDGPEPAPARVRVAVLLERHGWRRRHGRRCDDRSLFRHRSFGNLARPQPLCAQPRRRRRWSCATDAPTP